MTPERLLNLLGINELPERYGPGLERFQRNGRRSKSCHYWKWIKWNSSLRKDSSTPPAFLMFRIALKS